MTRAWFASVDSNVLLSLAATNRGQRNLNWKRHFDKSYGCNGNLRHQTDLLINKCGDERPNKLRFHSFAFSTFPNQTETTAVTVAV